MPQYEVQVTAKLTVTRRIVVDEKNVGRAKREAVNRATATPADWEVPGVREYTTAVLDPQELEDFGTDEIEIVKGD